MDRLSVDDQEDEIITNSISSSSNFFTCEICIEPIPLNQELFKKSRGSEHHRNHHFCSDCIAKYIEVKLQDYGNASEVIIKCPSINCDMVLDPLSCRSILPQRVFDRWCQVLCESAVLLPLTEESKRPGFYNRRSRVYCPFQDCSELILNECGDIGVTILKCPNCKKLFCFQCQIPCGARHQCNSTRSSSDENDILLLEMAKCNQWSRCPTCNQCIELIQGCPLVTCRCKTHFCYACGSKVATNWSCVCGKTKGHVPYVELTKLQLCFGVFLLFLLFGSVFFGIYSLYKPVIEVNIY